MDQASKMLNMRIQIDVWSKGLGEDMREEIRENLRGLFCQLPARRVWIYLKLIRLVLLNGKKTNRVPGLILDSNTTIQGAEDVSADGMFILSNCASSSNLSLARHLIRPGALCRLTRSATLNETNFLKNKDFSRGSLEFYWQTKT